MAKIAHIAAPYTTKSDHIVSYIFINFYHTNRSHLDSLAHTVLANDGIDGTRHSL